MKIDDLAVQGITVLELTGELTWKSAEEAQQRILERTQPEGKMVLDMSGVPYMSSAGLRLLLVAYRRISGQGGRAVVVGLSEELRHTMEITGFLDFFTHRDSLVAGLAELTS